MVVNGELVRLAQHTIVPFAFSVSFATVQMLRCGSVCNAIRYGISVSMNV